MISKSKILACFILEDEFGRKTIDCNNRFIFENIKLYINEPQLIKEIGSGFVFSQFNPYVDIFYRNMKEIFASETGQYLNLNTGLHQNHDDHYLLMFCTRFNHFFENIKKEAKNPEFKIALNLFQKLDYAQ